MHTFVLEIIIVNQLENKCKKYSQEFNISACGSRYQPKLLPDGVGCPVLTWKFMWPENSFAPNNREELIGCFRFECHSIFKYFLFQSV